ncbi:MAG TPA: peptidylprolyl isomerase [Xanthomonadaceae bacterium]|nr:peptidylprolyl isomerase [Xanthomonadaceae bacterium]
MRKIMSKASIKCLAMFGLVVLSQSILPGAHAGEGSDAFVVRRGSAEIRMADVDARLARVPPEDRVQVMDSPQRIEQLLLNLLTQRQLADKALALGLDQDASVEREMRLYRDEIMARRYLEHVQNQPGQFDLEQAARERYLADPSVGLIPERRHVSHILITLDDRDEAAAREMVEGLRSELVVQPERFEEIAMTHSEDPSVKDNHGRLGVLSDDYDEDFVAGANQLKEIGALSGPVRTQFGYHLIRLDHLEPPVRRTFEEMRPALFMQMTQRLVRELRRREIDQVSAEPLEADPEAVASLRERYRLALGSDSEAR